MKKYSILLVEDDEITRNRLTKVIVGLPSITLLASVGTCTDAHKVLEKNEPDVMLTDLGLPDGSGFDLIKAISQLGYSTKIMVITVFADEKNVLSAIELGATSYLVKDGTDTYIGESLEQLINGESPISPSIARHLLKKFQRIKTTLIEKTVDVPKLTNREHEVLSYLTKGFSFTEIGDMLSITTHTVTTHVRHIYQKLAVRSRGEAVFEAIQLGLITTNSDEDKHTTV